MIFKEMETQLPPFRKTTIFRPNMGMGLEISDTSQHFAMGNLIAGCLIMNRDLKDANKEFAGDLDGLSVVCDHGVYSYLNFSHWSKIPIPRGARKKND